MNYQFDFWTLNPGDQVIHDTGSHYGERYSLERVERVTSTLIFLKGVEGRKFKRQGGGIHPRQHSYSIGRDCLEPVTPELLEKIERANLIAFFSSDRVKSFSTPQLRAIKAAFKEASKQQTDSAAAPDPAPVMSLPDSDSLSKGGAK